MALSVIVIPGDGVTKQFAVPFSLGYLDNPDFVTCRVGNEVDGTGAPLYRALTFLSEENVVVSGATPGVGVPVRFERTVPRNRLLVDYEDDAIINEENMNLSQLQLVMLVQEIADGRFSQFQTNVDMAGNRFTSMGNPINPQDGATKSYVDASYGSNLENLNATIAARDAAIVAKDAAVVARNTAVGAAANAEDSAGSAYQSRQDALAASNAAASSATTAYNEATRSKTEADRAQTIANGIGTDLSTKYDKAGGTIAGPVSIVPTSGPALLNVGGNAVPGSVLSLKGDASSEKRIGFDYAGITRWALRTTTALNFALSRYDAAGAIISNPLAVLADGTITFDRKPTVNGGNMALESEVVPKTGGTFTGPIAAGGGNFIGSVGTVLQVTGFTSTTSGDQFKMIPTDFGAGKPFYFINKGTVANEWRVGLWDGTAGSGRIIHQAQNEFAVRPTVSGVTVALSSDIAGAGVTSFNGRSGAVTPGNSDYNAGQIVWSSTNVADALTSHRNRLPCVAVEEYGATGNNTADDSAAIQAAINALPARGGRIVFAAKAYYCANSIVVKGKLVEFIGIPSGGSGNGTLLRFAANKGLRFEQASYSSMRGFSVMGSGGDTTDQLLGIGFDGGNGGCAQMFFEQVNFVGGFKTMWLQNVLSIRFRHCRFVDAVGPHVVYMAGGPDATHGVDNVEFQNCNFGAQGTPAGVAEGVVYMNGKAHGVKFTDCPILFGMHGIITTRGDASWSSPKFLSMTAGGFENGQGNAVRAIYGDDFRFNSMYASTDGSDDGIYMAATFAGRLKLSACTIRGNGRDGVRVVGGRFTANGCDFINNGFKTTGDGVRFETAANDFILTGNFFGVGPDGTNNQRTGVTFVTDTSANGMISGNRFRGNVTSAFRVGATTTTPSIYASLNSFA